MRVNDIKTTKVKVLKLLKDNSIIKYNDENGKEIEKNIDNKIHSIEAGSFISIATCQEDIIAYQSSNNSNVIWSNNAIEQLDEASYNKDKRRNRYLHYILMFFPILSLIPLIEYLTVFQKEIKRTNDDIISIINKSLFEYFSIKLTVALIAITDVMLALKWLVFFYFGASLGVSSNNLLIVHVLLACCFAYLHNKQLNEEMKLNKEIKEVTEAKLSSLNL